MTQYQRRSFSREPAGRDYHQGLAGNKYPSSISLTDTECYDLPPAPRLGTGGWPAPRRSLRRKYHFPMSRTDTGCYDAAPAPVFHPRIRWSS